MIAAVFFDFDGVIADSVDVKTAAFCALYEPHGVDVVAEVRRYHLAHGGISRFEKFRHWQTTLVNGPADEATIADLSARFGAEVKSRVIASNEIPGAGAALAVLHEAGIPMFVVSGTPEDELKDIVAARGLAQYFREVRGAPATKETILNDLMARHGLAAGACVMVGDAMTDYDAAHATGVPFIGVAHDANAFPPGTDMMVDLTDLGPRLIAAPARSAA